MTSLGIQQGLVANEDNTPVTGNAESIAPSASKPLAPGDAEFFEKQVRPLLVEHCYECHSGDEASGGLLLDSREGVRRGGDTGTSVLPGDVDASLLIQAVRYNNRDLQMPPQNRLPSDQIAVLEEWVRRGAPDPRDEIAGHVPATGMSIEDGREFWSFQPIRSPAIPEVANRGWVRNPVDSFVLARLESNGIQPAAPADRRTLIRRLTLDLTGLPPTHQEIEAFVADESPTAYEDLVESLLASPHYGVRWGRHWLDVARYADSNGLDENLAFGNAWRYRDYVINAFNNDKPVDRFIQEQIAGDLFPDTNEETKTATGFLVLGAKVLAEPDREKLSMDTIDEQLDTIGKAFMGLTLGCVRCHDHKFDPVKQTDYYALAAILKGTRSFADSNTGAIRHWNEHSFASDEEIESMKSVDAKIAELNAAANKFKNQAFESLRQATKEAATDYLVAAMRVDVNASLSELAKIAEPTGLHPRILHHCRRHLEFNADDPLFQPWHEWKKSGDVAACEQHYRRLFEKAALPAVDGEDPAFEVARAALKDPSGFLAVPAKPEFALDAETITEYHRLLEIARLEESAAPDLPAAMGVTDGDVVTELPVHIRGSHLNLGEKVGRGFPVVFDQDIDRQPFPEDRSGRLKLAHWLTNPAHPLTARVYVNRIWGWHFGQAIVGSTENFGALGERPSHPELLDWLASELMRRGWSTKELHRMIVLSNTYRMSSDHPDAAKLTTVDPENRLHWKFRLRRLEAEEIRDGILAVSGRLDESLGGKTVPLRNRQFVFNHTSVDHTKYDSLRRATFLPIIRNNLYSLFEQFDFPDPTMPTGHRNETVVAPQSLLLMNSDWVMGSAETVATNLLELSMSDDSRLEEAYRRILGRTASRDELQRASQFVEECVRVVESRSQAWSLLCQGLMICNEFMYVR